MDWVEQDEHDKEQTDRGVLTFWQYLVVAAYHAVDSHNAREQAYGASALPDTQYENTIHVLRDWRGRSGGFSTRTSVAIMLNAQKRGIRAIYQDGTKLTLDFVAGADDGSVALTDGTSKFDVEGASKFLLKRVLYPEPKN